jgi:prepilin-type N-terminal cleavage/methylation domain-containing protein
MKTTYPNRKYKQSALVCLVKKVWSSQPQKDSDQAGFSLVESLVAVVVVSVLLTGIAPFLALTFGQRVQARRVDQATQAARAYLDGLRSGAIPVPSQFNNGNFNTPDLGIPALTTLPTDPGTRVSTDGTPFNTSNPQHLVIQAIRSPCEPVPTGCTNNTDLNAVRVQGYRVSIRVYRADAFESGTAALVTPFNASATSLGTSQSAFSGTLGSKSRPLLVMQSDIVANSSTTGTGGTTFRNYQDRFGN